MLLILLTPISELFADQTVADQISAVSDCLELRPELTENTWRADNVTHAHISDPDLDINLPWSDSKKSRLVQYLLQYRDSLHTLSFHVARNSQQTFIDGLGRYALYGKPMTAEAMIENVASNTSWVRKQMNTTVLIENNNYHPTGAYEIVCDPDFLSDVIEASGSGFLLDVAHAKVSAHNLGISDKNYFGGLPLDATKQIHLSKPAIHNGQSAIDAHEIPTTEDLRQCIALLANQVIEDTPVTVEYYKSAEKLVEVLREFRTISLSSKTT